MLKMCIRDRAMALRTLRNTTNYTVDVDVVSYAGGQLGDILIKDKALNGFKLLPQMCSAQYLKQMKLLPPLRCSRKSASHLLSVKAS